MLPLMLGIMIFVTSPLNDLGDISGDRGAGQRTIPIVIGKKRTLKLSVFFSSTMIVLSWILYGYSTSKIGIIIPLLTSLHATITILSLGKMLANLDNMDFVRRFGTKKIYATSHTITIVTYCGSSAFQNGYRVIADLTLGIS